MTIISIVYLLWCITQPFVSFLQVRILKNFETVGILQLGEKRQRNLLLTNLCTCYILTILLLSYLLYNHCFSIFSTVQSYIAEHSAIFTVFSFRIKSVKYTCFYYFNLYQFSYFVDSGTVQCFLRARRYVTLCLLIKNVMIYFIRLILEI